MPWKLGHAAPASSPPPPPLFRPAGETQPLLTPPLVGPPGAPSCVADGLLVRANEARSKALARGESAADENTFRRQFWTAVLFAVALFTSSAIAALLLYVLYHSRSLLVLQYVLLITVIPSFLVRQRRLNDWKAWLVRLIILGTWIGIVVGLDLYYRHFIVYLRYEEMPTHTNVMAAQAASTVDDAGKLQFSGTAEVDATRAVGYRDADLGVTLCVAPIVDHAMGMNDSVSFFAVGEDCCDWRASFRCGETSVAVTYPGALVRLTAEQLGERGPIPVLANLAATGAPHERFERAIHMSSQVFSYTLAERRLLVDWTSDPTAAQEKYWMAGVTKAICWGTLVFVVSIPVGVLAAMGREPVRRWLQRYMLN